MKRLIYTFALLFVTLSMMAVTITGGTVLYLKPNSNWTQSNARFAAYFFGNGDAWVSMTDSDGDGIYSCTSPSGSYTSVIFCRMNPSASANNWNNKWNQTSDLTYNGTNNCYTVKDGTWDNGDGTWSLLKRLSVNSKIYFVKPDDWSASTIQFLIGHDSYSIGYAMSKIDYTNLYYLNTVSIDGYNGWSITNTDAVWPSKEEKFWDRYLHTLKRTAGTDAQVSPLYNLIDNLRVRSDNATSYDFDFDTSLSSYTSLNHTHKINVTTDGSASTDGGSVKASSYKLNSANTTIATSGKTSIEAAYTATVTLTATPTEGYVFVGWYDGSTRLSVDAEYKYIAGNSDKVITAKFTKPVVAGTKELCGGASDWSNMNAMTDENSDGVFVKIFENVQPGTHKFKVVYNGDWLGFDNVNIGNSIKCESDGSNDKNIQFILKSQANVMIAYDKNSSKISLKILFPVGEEFYFSHKAKGNRFAVFLFGTGGNSTWMNLEVKHKNIYSINIPEGNWDGLIYCDLNSNTNEWGNNNSNLNKKTVDLLYNGENDWYIWGIDNDDAHDNDSYWRNFENLIYAEQKLYFKPDSNWEADGARFAAYYWDILGENRWADCVYNEEGHVYEVKAPTVVEGTSEVVWTNIKFVRMNPASTDNTWDNKWNQTADLTFDGKNDFFLIKLTKKNDQGNWDWDTADPNNWIRFSNPFKDVVFFKLNAALKGEQNKRFSTFFWNGFGEERWVKMSPLTTHEGVYYIVVPDGYWTGANICSMNPNTTGDDWTENGQGGFVNVLNQTNNLTYHADKLLYVVPERWDPKVPGDGCWTTFPLTSEELEIKDGVNNGAYYQSMKYTLTIPGSEVNKWHWISLPYDVNVADIKSNITPENPYGTDFIMKRYATEVRAGWAGEKPTADEDNNTWAQLDTTDVLKAGRGYILGVNTSNTYKENGVTLTFPAKDNFHVVNDQVDANNLDYSKGLSVNSNWHLIGTGLYGETTGIGSGDTEVNYVAYPTSSGSDYTYHYLATSPWPGLDDAFIETQFEDITKLEKYKAFFVQHSGEYSFSKASTKQSSAPRRAPVEELIEQYYINIVGEKDTARTAIFLAEDGADDYVVGKDFLHFGVTGQTAQLYTKQDSRLLAFNHLKREDRIVDLGGYLVNAGEYTISLVDNGEASVELIDSYTGESVDLTSGGYTFTSEKGSLDGRFRAKITFAEKDATTLIGDEMAGDLVVSNNGGLIVVDGLSVGADVWIFDAVGRCVDRFVADGECHELNIGTGVYVLKTSVESVKFVVW